MHLSQVPSQSVHTSSCPNATMEVANTTHGRMFLVHIDAHSKWIKASATSSATMECLRQVFAQLGVTETVVTDNGTCFTSDEFEAFLKVNGVCHLMSAP